MPTAYRSTRRGALERRLLSESRGGGDGLLVADPARCGAATNLRSRAVAAVGSVKLNATGQLMTPLSLLLSRLVLRDQPLAHR